MVLPRIRIPRISWRDLTVTLGPFVLLVIVAFWLALHFVKPAPPDTIVISAGPEGSVFQVYAQRYTKVLAREGVKLKILPSQGSLENLKRLSDPGSGVDVGFVQGGIAALGDAASLTSLGSVAYAPMLIFYRSPRPINLLSELRGKRIAIGRQGSGARVLAENLLKGNGIEPGGPTKLVDLSDTAATGALVKGEIDAAFLMGDSATPAAMRQMLHTDGIRLYDFVQAEGYVRRYRYLVKLELPPGSLDLGRNAPDKTLRLVGPTVELIGRPDLHPALSDLLIEAAREAHGRATVLQQAGEFPAPLEHEYRIDDDALRFYKTGKTFAYRHLPFWLASLVDRAAVLLVPLLVVLIPGLKLVPALYRWRINGRVYRRYGELMALERVAFGQTTPEQRKELLERLDEIEKRVITGKLPGSAAEQVYVLRQHIHFVRSQLVQPGAIVPPSPPISSS
jgi:NMT1 family protein